MEGKYIEQYDIVSKFERLEDKVKDSELSFSQFAKMYSPTWQKKEKQNNIETTDIDYDGFNNNPINEEDISEDDNEKTEIKVLLDDNTTYNRGCGEKI